MKKILLILLAVLLIVSMLFMGIGCKEEATEESAQAEEETTEEDAAEETTKEEETTEEEVVEEDAAVEIEITDEPITITAWAQSGTHYEFLKTTTEMYMQEHPNVTFDVISQPFDFLQAQGATAVEGGQEELDMLWYWYPRSFDWGPNGLLRELGPYM